MSDTTKERAVMAAYDDGKPIQRRARNTLSCDWKDSPRPSWNWSAFEYRSKPEPLTLWVNVYIENGDHLFCAYPEEDFAIRSRSKGGRTVKMQEVIE